VTRRFYVPPSTLDSDSITLDGALAQRIASVLRLQTGAQITLFDGSGDDVTVRLDAVSARRVTATIEGRERGPAEATAAVHLYQSITKGERFEWLVEKATELGVASVTPLMTARAVVKTASGGNRADRWRRIAVEAAEQCGRSFVPEVAPPQALDAALASAPGLLLLPYEDADHTAPSIAQALGARIDDLYALGAVSIFIGPEGGYEPAEIERASESGAIVVTLGDRVLRSETAGVVALTLVMQAAGELG
jgi:16S rRNA (uracil1498-N3)-methyltransferase